MATLLHGPRLGGPSSTGFKVWLRFSGAATCVLETRESGTATWTTQDTQAVDTGLDNTVVLTATGLLDATPYDYRVLADSVQVASSSTMTMPLSGNRVVLYYVCDGHGDNQLTYDAVRADWEATYEPAGIPGVILQGGDYTSQAGFTAATKREWLDTGILPEIAEVAGAGRACERLPLLYIWDDWDFAGNNSSRNSQGYFASEPDSYVAAQDIWDILWRDHPQPTPPSRSYAVEVAGIPIIVLDNRSQRTHRVGTSSNASTGLRGDEPLRDDISFVGLAHRQWVIDTLTAYRTRGLAFLVTGSTLRDGVGTTHIASARDSIGLCFRAERNYLLQNGWPSSRSDKLLIISGDDHNNSLSHTTLREPVYSDYEIGTYNDPGTLGPANAPSILYDLHEFKVSSGDSANVVGTADTFGRGNRFYNGDGVNTFIRFDITPRRGVEYVTARITFVKSADGTTLVSTGGPSAGKSGDFFYADGVIQPYSGDQLYPVENSPAAAPVFGLAYIDEVAGTMHTEGDVFRSYGDKTWGALVRSVEDYEEADDRDTLVRIYERAPEANPPLP